MSAKTPAMILAVALLAAACGDSTSATTAAPTTTADFPATTAAAVTAAAPSSADRLINCDTNIAADVPAFYSDYFRCTDISLDGDTVVISGLDQPPHLSYYYGQGNDQYQDFDYSRGDAYHPNPNTISTNRFTLRIPLDPVESGTVIDSTTVNLTVGDATDFPMGTAGVALDGAAYFNPLAAPGDDIEDEKYTFDSNEGHPQQQGDYHYHAPSSGPLRVLQELGLTTTDQPGSAEIELYGVMCDGTVLMGQTELDGSAVSGELDAQAGHVHDIVDAGGTVVLANRYHIHMAPEIGANPRGLSPEARYYSTCDVS